MRKVATGELDAVVVAAAGLRRLGRINEATELLDPAPDAPRARTGRAGHRVPRGRHGRSRRLLAQVLDDEYTRAAVTAERAVLAGAGGRLQRADRARWPMWCPT